MILGNHELFKEGKQILMEKADDIHHQDMKKKALAKGIKNMYQKRLISGRLTV